MDRKPNRRLSASAFTLLELLLALVLTTIILGLIGAAVFSLFRFLDVRRTRLEESQVARAVLRRFADDLKGTVHETTLDFSGVSGLSDPTSGSTGGESGSGGTEDPKTPSGGTGAGGTSGTSGGSGSQGTGGTSRTGSQSGGTSGEKEETEENASSTQSSTLIHTKPGLYGTQYELEIDVSRLPRIDEYSPVLLGNSQTAKIPSDIKTVSYYVRTALDGGKGENLGLIRREVDRSVTLYAMEQGEEASLEANETVLAPEVVAVEFRYFNGTEWLSEWNSEDEGALPVAVEVAVAVAPPSADDPLATSATGPVALDQASAEGSPNDQYQVYRLVVPLPTAEPPKEEGEAMEAESTESAAEETSP